MNINSILDVISLSTSAFFLRKSKYFREGIQSKSILENLNNTTLDFPEITGEGFYEVEAKTLIGNVMAGFRIAQWKGKDYPTVIYHHGASEEPYDFSFNKIFPIGKEDIKANLIVVRSPYCSSMKEFMEGIKSLTNYVTMLSVSTVLYEHIIKYAREQGTSNIIATGVSLGGFITNIHHTYYNTADVYKPLLAGPAIDEALLNSVYSKMIIELSDEDKAIISGVLNFEEDFKKQTIDNVYPLLGRYDQVVKYEVQNRCYNKDQIKVIDKGHLTGSTSFKILRNHILE